MHPITELIESFDPEHPTFRATELYNEGWLLRSVLLKLSTGQTTSAPLAFLPGATWFSEALLPTAFKPRYHGDALGESRTSADGVIGHFVIGDTTKAGFALTPDTRQFVVVEAKLRSKLAPGTANAPYFDQAARNVACMAEALKQAARPPTALDYLAFVVLAPQAAIDKGHFSVPLALEAINTKVQQRVTEYAGDLDSWYQDWFTPVLASIHVISIGWESVIDWIREGESDAAAALDEFYTLCLKYN